MSGHWYGYSIPYFELLPAFECYDKETAKWQECFPDDFCHKEVEWRYNYEDEKSLHNWVEKLHLECEQPYKIGLIGSSYFIGFSCTVFWVPSLSDVYGRSTIYRVGIFLIVLTLSCIYLAKSAD
jgi:hypothetical protein